MTLQTIKNEVKKIRLKTPIDTPLQGEEFEYMYELITNSKYKKEFIKQHGNIVSIYTIGAFMGTKCFGFTCEDGAKDDWGQGNLTLENLGIIPHDYTKDEYQKWRSAFHQAMRYLVADQNLEFKKKHGQLHKQIHHEYRFSKFCDLVEKQYGQIPLIIDDLIPGNPMIRLDIEQKKIENILKAHQKILNEKARLLTEKEHLVIHQFKH